ncbi:MAG: hypothetical protein JWM08_2500, partial [Candidatus Angelobacter sp.]|nr:hypothetical protein [Candidatus Angelobacter sp.]
QANALPSFALPLRYFVEFERGDELRVKDFSPLVARACCRGHSWRILWGISRGVQSVAMNEAMFAARNGMGEKDECGSGCN